MPHRLLSDEISRLHRDIRSGEAEGSRSRYRWETSAIPLAVLSILLTFVTAFIMENYIGNRMFYLVGILSCLIILTGLIFLSWIISKKLGNRAYKRAGGNEAAQKRKILAMKLTDYAKEVYNVDIDSEMADKLVRINSVSSPITATLDGTALQVKFVRFKEQFILMSNDVELPHK